jgi:hypothetical protein
MFLTSLSFSQTNKFDIGIDAGPSLILMYGYNASQYKSIAPKMGIGTSGSLSFQYNINAIFSVKTGLQYDLEGCTQPLVLILLNGGAAVPEYLPQRLNLNYMTIPFLAKASIGKKIKFLIDIGPYLSILTIANGKVFETSYPVIYDQNIRPSLKPYNFGVQAGVGIAIPIKTKYEITFEDRNSIGLIDIRKEPSAYLPIKTFSSAFLLGFNYKFGKAKTTTKSG